MLWQVYCHRFQGGPTRLVLNAKANRKNLRRHSLLHDLTGPKVSQAQYGLVNRPSLSAVLDVK